MFVPESEFGVAGAVMVNAFAPFDQRTRGVALSVSGGEPQVVHVVGTVIATTGEEKSTFIRMLPKG